MTVRNKLKIKFSIVVLLAIVAGLLSYPRVLEKIPRAYAVLNKLQIRQGLDLQGGFHLEYKVDLSQVEAGKRADALQALQNIIEHRVNAFGVSEPLVYIKKSGSDEILVVELAGVKDINQAKEIIKETPLLEFKEESLDTSNQVPQETLDQVNAQQKTKTENVLQQTLAPGTDFAQLAKDNSQDPSTKDKGGDLGTVKSGQEPPEINKVLFEDASFKDGTVYPQVVETEYGFYIIKKIATTGTGDAQEVHAAQIVLSKAAQPAPKTKYTETGLTGKNLKNASVGFSNQALSEPVVDLQFDAEGTKLFDSITKQNVGKHVAIFLDGEIVSDPTVNEEISSGQAQISGNFTMDQANALVKSLNEGSLPVPIGDPIYEQSVDASLGQSSLATSLKAGAIGLVIVLIFMMIYYRYLGFIASVALLIYTALMVAIFKLSTLTPWSITFTLSGIAGFILSIGMAVDANVLIFERTKEELRKGRDLMAAVDEGFRRAWPSIRDGNYSTILTSIILIWVGTGFVKGFAIILVVGVLISMFTAIVLVKIILKFTLGEWAKKRPWLIIRMKKNPIEENKKV